MRTAAATRPACGIERVLVTGAGGRVGRHVVDALAGEREAAVFDLVPPVQDVPFIEGDVLHLDAVRAALALRGGAGVERQEVEHDSSKAMPGSDPRAGRWARGVAGASRRRSSRNALSPAAGR